MDRVTTTASRVCELPPVILHPFTDPGGTDQLIESSRASMMLQGLLPAGDITHDTLQHRFLAGRFTEIRMLFYVGRDLERWVAQCVEFAQRDPDLQDAGLTATSFIQLLIDHAPSEIRSKLAGWGVADFRSIFRRAIGLNSLFSEAPRLEELNPHFIRYYYRYADQLYQCRLGAEGTALSDPGRFRFSLYASGEYSRMLERQWEAS